MVGTKDFDTVYAISVNLAVVDWSLKKKSNMCHDILTWAFFCYETQINAGNASHQR